MASVVVINQDDTNKNNTTNDKTLNGLEEFVSGKGADTNDKEYDSIEDMWKEIGHIHYIKYSCGGYQDRHNHPKENAVNVKTNHYFECRTFQEFQRTTACRAGRSPLSAQRLHQSASEMTVRQPPNEAGHISPGH